MYVRVLFLLCAFANSIKADYSSEAKYIDLLPEDEKTEFLNRIAKRILSEIRSRRGQKQSTQQSSVELSDETLNENDAYVKKIMDEESQDMKNIRRTEDELKNNKNSEVEVVELKVKPLEENDPKGQETLENVDLSTSENKIRIKKGTPETNVERSTESTDKAEETLTTVPVHLLYDNTGNLQSTINAIKTDDIEYTVSETLGHNNPIRMLIENSEKKSGELNIDNIDFINESKENKPKDQLKETLINESSPKLEENEGDNIPRAQTVIYDFEPKQDEVTEYRNETTEQSTEVVHAKQFELDIASDKWIEIHPKNVTEDALNASSPSNNEEKVTEDELKPSSPSNNEAKVTEDELKLSSPSNNEEKVTEDELKPSSPSNNEAKVTEDELKLSSPSNNEEKVTEDELKPSSPSNNEAKVTKDELKPSSPSNNEEKVTVNDEKTTVKEMTTPDVTTASGTSHTSTINILNTSEWIFKTSNDSGGSDLQNIEAITYNTPVEHTVNVTEIYIQPATPSSINKAEFARKEMASTIKVRSVSKEEKTEGTDLNAPTKAALRTNSEKLNDFNEHLGLINNNYPYSKNDDRYQIFEVVHDKPLISAKQINAGYAEAPYYVPVYNYASNNAFYNPYNRFGPNTGNNPELIEMEDTYSNKDLIYDPSKFSLQPGHNRIHSKLKKKHTKEDPRQRKSKYYKNDEEYDIGNKNPYPKVPVLKGKVVNIQFNPNDYLDMDYYLGRSNNENLEQPKHVVKKGKPLEVSNSQDTSSEVIDPISKEPHNMKNVIRNIRLQMNSLKPANKSTATRSHHHKLQDKLKIVDKILGNPVFRGLNNSLVVFIPKTRTKGAKEVRDNIAVDYYFSRMSSGEIPYLEEELASEQELELRDTDITQLMKKHFLKTDTKQTEPFIEEQQLNIPLILHNLLKPDLAMKDNNVNVSSQKVKKPKSRDFEVLLNAYLNVLKDMVEHDNEKLKHYDWLGSAVDVQSALDKLIKLSDIMHVQDDVHIYDRNLFKYVLFIFKTSLRSLAEAGKLKKDSKRRNGKDLKSRMNPDMQILHQLRAWQEISMHMREMTNSNVDVYDYLLKEFEVFLLDLRNNLNELHEAIKGIASVTKYNTQRWYLDLKDLYLTPLDRKVSLILLLHLASTRLFGLIEESAKKGAEEDFIRYVRTHKAEVERSREEFVLVLRILKELNRLKK